MKTYDFIMAQDLNDRQFRHGATSAAHPASFANFDEWGCDWATDINHAYRLAATYGEDAIIWRCPHQGNPIRWVRVEHQGDSIQAC